MRRNIPAVCLCLVAAMSVYPSLAGGQQSGGSGGSGSRKPSTTPGTVPGTTPNNQQYPRDVYLTGKVMVDNGGTLPGPVAVLSVCSGNSHKETMTSPDGYFSFMMGDRRTALMPDASEPARPFGPESAAARNGTVNDDQMQPERTLTSCEIRAELSGYSSSSIPLNQSMNNTDIGVIILHNRSKQSGESTVSLTTLQAPEKARKDFEKGRAQLDKGKLQDAEKSLQKATEEYPKFAEAWLMLGDLRKHQDDVAGASTDYEEAIKADGNYPVPYLRLAQIAGSKKDWQETRVLTEKLIALDPVRYPGAYYYNAVANYNLQRMEPAEKSALRAESLDKQHHEPRVEILLAMIYSSQQKYSAAAEHYRAFLQLVPEGPVSAQVKDDLAKLEAINKPESASVDAPKP